MDRAVVAVPLFLVPALGITQGGFQPDAWVWAGTVAAWAAAVGVAVAESGGVLRRQWRWPGLGLLLLAWTLASMLWSAEPQQSLLEARRAVVYAAVTLALVVLARRQASMKLATGTHVAVTILIVYSLLRFLLGRRVSTPFEGHLLSQPLGYANAIGILAAMSMLLALAPLLDGGTLLRGLAAASVPLLALALTLTSSNASFLALGIGLVTVSILSPGPLAVLRATAVVAVPSLPVVWAGMHSDITGTTPRIDGVALAAIAAGASLSAGVLGAFAGRASAWRASRRKLAVAGALVVALAVVVVVPGSSTQPRRSYYAVAWHEFLAHPLLGSGAGTYGGYWLRSGLVVRWGGALDAHSLYLETLAELGPFGLVVLLAFLLYPLRRVFATRHVPGVAPAAGSAVAFLVHSGVDWDWELPAVVVAGLACLAAVLFADEPDPAERLGAQTRIVAGLIAVALGFASIAGTFSNVRPSAAKNSEAPATGASLMLGQRASR